MAAAVLLPVLAVVKKLLPIFSTKNNRNYFKRVQGDTPNKISAYSTGFVKEPKNLTGQPDTVWFYGAYARILFGLALIKAAVGR